MRTTIASLGIALFATLGAQAQETMSSPPPARMDAAHHECIMAGADTWTTLGLSTEQMAKVKEIQAACQKDHEAVGTKSTGHVGKHEAELKAVLTPEQFTNWSKWCSEQRKATKTKPESTK